MKNKRPYILGFHEIDSTKIPAVGGKGANLGELARIEGISVPDGFCVSTDAFKSILAEAPRVNELIDQLSQPGIKDSNKPGSRPGALCAEIRRAIEETVIPDDIREEVARHIARLGEKNAFAVRSSATAEDLPSASFAGQQDSYLNITGTEEILKHIRKCWASLFTDRAVIYRVQNGFDHRNVYLSVVVQQMVFPQAAGILFTADPVTSNRKVVSIDAGFGLGEAMVSGLVNADHYKVRNGAIIDKNVSAKKLAIYPAKNGGTKQQEIEPGKQNAQVLTDEQILELERIGRTIEEHFGQPQDIEWCLADDKFYIVQSRPITTLFPIPEANDDTNHVYVSVGHQQMMTDAMKPLGLSFYQLTSFAPMRIAGGRLFVDVTRMLATPGGRQNLMNTLGQSDPLTRDALMTIIERKFIQPLDDNNEVSSGKSHTPPAGSPVDPSVVSDLVKKSRAALETSRQTIQTKPGADVFDFILEDLRQLKTFLFDPQSMAVLWAAINASAWINEKMNEWLGEKNAADTLSQSVPDNVTSEMGLALLDVADVIRPYPEVIDYLSRHSEIKNNEFLDELLKFNGGKEARDAIAAYLDKYGMRCAGEIDITKSRWMEKPATLVPLILNNTRNVEPGAGKRKFGQGLQEALKKEGELLERLRQLQGGEQKAEETKQKIDMVRNFAGYREYPKYAMVSRYFVYKQALLKEAEKLVQANVIHEKEDVFYLSFEEFREAVRINKLDYEIVSKRKEEFKSFEKLTPPRVITSDGEIITGKYKREDLPAGAIAGLPVSSGVIEGRARVILDMEEADLEDGDILVTTFTDPSWTPLFISIKGLVTEVGGLMTHGAVIAREYGLPAVVGVENATRLIEDGQRIRVNGTDGYVEIL